MKRSSPISVLLFLFLASTPGVMAALPDQENPVFQTKPRKLESGQLFYLHFLPEQKMLAYEPCVGFHKVEVLKKTATEFVIRITGSGGISLNPLSGKETPKSELKGKTYLLSVAGRVIEKISEVEHERNP